MKPFVLRSYPFNVAGDMPAPVTNCRVEVVASSMAPVMVRILATGWRARYIRSLRHG